jgi:cellulose biosynthesis protein BcsQ
LNRYNENYPICKECAEAVEKFYPERLLKTMIKESPEIMNASSLGKSIFELYPGSGAAEDIKNLVIEVNGGGL